MTEHDDIASRERIARRAVWDYLSVGPEPHFGELEVDALTDWINTCRDVPLEPKNMANVAWMHVERAWSRVVEEGSLIGEVSPEIATLTQEDLVLANDIFGRVGASGEPLLSSHATVTRLSLPMFELVLTGRDKAVDNHSISQYLAALYEAMEPRLQYFRTHGTPHDVTELNAALGLALVNAAYLRTDYLALPSAYRHFAGRGSHYSYWHTALHNRDNGDTYKVRFAPNGPSDYVVVSPEHFGNADFPTDHGRGTIEALVRTSRYFRERRALRQPKPLDRRVIEHTNAVDIRIDSILATQVNQLQGHEKSETVLPDNAYHWYQTLSPFEDPCHISQKGLLDVAVATLEATPDLRVQDQYALAWMYMESALSFEAQQTEKESVLEGSFDRAEDLLGQALETFTWRSPGYYETAVAYVAAPMYKALVMGRDIGEQMAIYQTQLAELASYMVADYDQVADTSSNEAQTLALLLQHMTVYLVATDVQNQSYVALPASPRQRGGGEVPRGWDFAIWEEEGEDDFAPGQFAGRIEDREDRYSVDVGVVTVTKKALGQDVSRRDFRTLRTVLADIDPATYKYKKSDYKSLARARRQLLRIINAA